jgi:K+-transporting ATPase ATPase C chain
MKTLWPEIRASLAAVLSLAVLLCGFYGLTVWLLGQALFPARANGSLVSRGGTVVGSSLIARELAGPGYFRPRPSSAGAGYDGAASGGSNLGPLSKALSEAVSARVAAYRAENGLPPGTLVPADAVTASASGLDPHISAQNARLQAPRVAKARGLTEEAVLERVAACTQGRDLGLLGEPRVNVLMLNLSLDGVSLDRR